MEGLVTVCLHGFGCYVYRISGERAVHDYGNGLLPPRTRNEEWLLELVI